jgi:HK97 family phage portal protein
MGIVRDFFFPDLQTTIEEVVDTAVSRSSILPPSRETNSVSPVQALKLVPVSRCLSVLENSMIQIPVEVYRGIEQIDTPSWLITPDVESNISQAEFVRDTVVSLAVHGNAFWYITRGNRGITNLAVLPYEDVAVHEDRFGNVTYYMGQKKIAPDRIKHLKFWHLPGQYMGEGPLQRHKDTLKAAWDLNNYFANWFDNSAIPTGILNTESHINQEQAQTLLEAFLESQRTRTPAVMGYGMKYEGLTLDPEAAQFLENQKFMARQIALMFGIPSQYLSLSIESSGLAYTNTNLDRTKLYEDGLQQYITRIEQALSDLLPRGQYAKFNLTSFLRPDNKTRYESYAIAINSGIMTVNEARELEGMPPLAEPEQPTQPEEPVAQPEEGEDSDDSTDETV